MGQPTLSVILLTCNRKKIARETLEYLLATTHVDYELLIVHNHNQTKEAEEMKGYITNLKLDNYLSLKKVVKIFNKKNRGVAGGRNDGMLKSSGLHRVYIDDDILAPDSWAEEMLKVVERVPEVATIGVSVEKDNFKVVTKNKVTFQLKNGNIGGAFAMIPDRTFKKLGFLCEDYGLYGLEDADLYQRVTAIGKWNVYLHPMKARHIDPEDNKEYRKFKDKIYQKASKQMIVFTNNRKNYVAGKGLYIPYNPKI